MSDNGSRDATQDVLGAHRATFGERLVTFRFEENRGFTPNLLKVVELASGDFCWLMGSDDEVEPGGLATVLAALEADPELSGLTLNRLNVDEEHPGAVHPDPPGILPSAEDTTYTTAEQIFSELAVLQDYISTQVISRERFNAAVAQIGPKGLAAGLNFPHLPILGAVIRRHPRWRWVAEPVVCHCIGRLAVKDTFDGGPTRYLITVTGDRERVWGAMFGRRSRLYRLTMRKMWLVQAQADGLVHFKEQPGQTLALDARMLISLTRAYGFLPEFWTRSLPVLLVPHGLSRPALAAMRRLKALAS